MNDFGTLITLLFLQLFLTIAPGMYGITMHLEEIYDSIYSLLRQSGCPSLHSVLVKFQSHLLSGRLWSSNRASVEEWAANLRDAGVFVEFE